MKYVVVPKDPLGDFIRVYLARAKDEEIRKRRAGSGGAVTAFLTYLLGEGELTRYSLPGRPRA